MRGVEIACIRCGEVLRIEQGPELAFVSKRRRRAQNFAVMGLTEACKQRH